MQENNSLNIITDDLLTEWDRKEYIKVLDELMQNLFNVKTNAMVVLSQLLSHEKKEKLLQVARDNGVDMANPQEVLQMIEWIKRQLQSFPVVYMTLAFEPSERTLRSFSSWFFSNVQQKVIFNVTVSKSVIGGAKIEFNGRIGDYSIQKTLSTLFNKNTTKQQVTHIPIHG